MDKQTKFYFQPKNFKTEKKNLKRTVISWINYLKMIKKVSI